MTWITTNFVKWEDCSQESGNDMEFPTAWRVVTLSIVQTQHHCAANAAERPIVYCLSVTTTDIATTH